MYDELVKALRVCADGEHCDKCTKWELKQNAGRNACEYAICTEAADAIENMSEAYDKLSRHMDDLAALMPRWIPVTERLPENDTAVLAHVYWPEYGDTMICYGHWHKGWFHLFHHVEGELISGYVVTHWMPLPEPPKEEK